MSFFTRANDRFGRVISIRQHPEEPPPPPPSQKTAVALSEKKTKKIKEKKHPIGYDRKTPRKQGGDAANMNRLCNDKHITDWRLSRQLGPALDRLSRNQKRPPR